MSGLGLTRFSHRTVVAFLAVGALLFGLNVGAAKALPATVSLTVHYFRDAGDYATPAGATGPWNVWIWKDAPGGADDVAINAPNGNAFTLPTGAKTLDSWNYSATLNLTITGVTSVHTQLGFIVRLGLWDATDIGFDRFITNIDPTTGKAEIWLKQGDKNVYTSVPRLGPGIKSASIDDFRKITVNLNRAPAAGTSGTNFTLCPVSTATASASASSSAAPVVPAGLTATAGNAKVFLKWTHATGATGYKVFRTTATVPGAPSGLTATAGNAKVFLKWTHILGATSYKVYRGTSATAITTLLGGDSTNGYTDSTALNNTTYYYAVKASNAAGDSVNSVAVISKPLTASTILTMPAPLPTAAAAIALPVTALGTSTANGYTDSTALNNTTYYYGVKSTNGTVDSAASALVSSKPLSTSTVTVMPTPTPSNVAVAPSTTGCAGAAGVPTISSATVSGSVATLNLASDVTLGTNYQISLVDSNKVDFGSQKTYSGKILTSTQFNASYIYSGTDLGATYTSANTKFRVWAPTASALSVKIYDTATAPQPSTTVPMTKDVNGTWVATATGDLNGKVYMYGVTVDDRTLETIDPYVRATTINGTRGVIVDLTKTDPVNFSTEKSPAFSGRPTDATVYELHVRDLSMDPTSGYPDAQKGKFSALTNFSTTYCASPTPAPLAPTGLVATAGNAKAFLSWTQSANSTGYKVFRGASATTATTQVGTSTVNGYTDTTAVNDTTYFYAVKATNGTADSAASAVVSTKPIALATATTIPGPVPTTPTPWACPGAASVKTGMGAIKDLGISHLELMPVYDFGSVNETNPTFNWGYDPQNPNVPEGSYSSDATNPTARITELKQGVQAIHSNGMRVVMDVIYNHVMNPNTFSEESLVPGYFFRTDALGNLTNQSGCGNDVASERPMVRKYIVDSVSYWAKQYHIDGFRFDIMSLIDKTTMSQVMTELKKIDSSIIVFGEGWSYDETKAQLSYANQSRQANAGTTELQSVGFFNDQMRDGVKGDTGNDILPGYVNGLAGNYINQVINGIFGQTATDFNKDKASARSWTATTPGQSINYVEVHDGLTLWDKLKASSYAGTDAEKQKQGRQAAALVFLSQGMPFIQAGQEMLRTKGGNANSYSPPETATTTAAKLTWELATSSLKWNSAYTNKANVDYYKGLIALRKAHPLFRMNSVADINQHYQWLAGYGNNALGFFYKNTGNDNSKIGDTWEQIAIGVNPNSTSLTMTLPSTGTWYVVGNDTAIGTATLQTLTGTNKVTVPAYSTVVVHN